MPALPRLDDNESARIAQYARGALRGAGVERVLPTPLDEVGAALHLHPVEDLFNLGDAPAGLVDRLRRLRKKVLGALDIRERTIYVDLTQAEERTRFTYGHELGHRVLPGHQEQLYFADDASTLRPDVHDLLEAEANRFSAELLFQGDLFTDMAAGSRIGMGVPLELAGQFQTSRHATIRRYVETSRDRCGLAVFGRYLVQQNGSSSMRLMSAIESPSFRHRFGQLEMCLPPAVSVTEQLGADPRASLHGEGGPIIAGTLTVNTVRGVAAMNYEVYSNTYFAFALIYPSRRIRLGTRIRVEDVADEHGL